MSHPNDKGLEWRTVLDHAPRGDNEEWTRYLEVWETFEGRPSRLIGSVYAEAHQTNEEAIRATWAELMDPVGPAWCADKDEYGETVEAVRWLAEALGVNLNAPICDHCAEPMTRSEARNFAACDWATASTSKGESACLCPKCVDQLKSINLNQPQD